MYYIDSGYGKHERLRNALIAALVLHAAVILGLSFDLGGGEYRSPQIEVTLATLPSSEILEEARLIAQANQRGLDERAEPEALPPVEPVQQPPAPRPVEEQLDNSEKTVTARNSARLVDSPQQDPLASELAALERQLEDQSQAYADMPRVRRLTSVSTRESVDAAYLHAFLRRLEAVGNRYYPEASVRYDIYGSLRLLVVVRQDGSLEDVRVLSSSGYAVLDEAAIKTVRMAAPFAPFPAELRKTTDKLEIIRTWHFEQNRLSSN
jgi:protein TonB